MGGGWRCSWGSLPPVAAAGGGGGLLGSVSPATTEGVAGVYRAQ